MAVFVDDKLLASRSKAFLATVKADCQSQFTMTDEGLAQQFLGARIFQGTGTAILDLKHCCETIVEILSTTLVVATILKSRCKQIPICLSPTSPSLSRLLG
jgi:hypothetical protein